MLATIGFSVGQQVRIKRNNDEYGLYTVISRGFTYAVSFHGFE